MAKETIRIEKNGETLIITKTAAETGGSVTEFEGFDEPSVGTPYHVHFKQEEWIQVIKGKMRVKTPDKDILLNEGDEYVFAPGEPHRFWNDGEERLHYRGYVRPSLNYEYFIRHVYHSANEAHDDKPGAFDAAYLLTRYKSEFDILDIPKAVKALVFPVLLLVGRATGKFGKFKDSPPSV